MAKISLKMSKSQIKKRAADEFFANSMAKPRIEGVDSSVALIMAGIPGAGKTEFVNSFIEANPIFKNNAIRIDLDEIIKIFEEYKPEEDYKFRDNGNAIIERIIDRSLADGYNFILDGTFSGDAAVRNVERALKRNYAVSVVVMLEDVDRAKEYVRIRKEKTKREIRDEAFERSIIGISNNLKIIKSLEANEGAEISVKFIRKSWNSEDSFFEYLESVDIDTFYGK